MNILVIPTSKNPSRGLLKFGSKAYPCALGKEGVTLQKKEGDYKSPAGKFVIRNIYYRYDKLCQPLYSQVPLMAILKEDGWCDDPDDKAYNRPVNLPHHASAEQFWRDDDLYDVIVVLGYNDTPAVAGKGSAIFMHISKNLNDRNYLGTEGCVALNKSDLLEILPMLTSNMVLEIKFD